MQDDQNPLVGEESSAAEGDGDRGRYSLMVRCASQSSLDECSQRAEPGARAQHASRLLDALARLRADAALTDVRLRACAEGAAAAGEGVSAHRAVLAASSPYFRAMFTQFDERTQHTITIQNVEPEALQAIVDYIYNPDSLVITEDNVQGILSGASLLAVPGARALCCAWLAAALAPDNALGIRAFADLHACHELAAAAARYLDQHFLQVLESDEFLALQADALAALIDSDRITVPNEEVILDAVIRWMQHDPEERRGTLGRLLAHVRLPLLAREALVARAAAEPLCSAAVEVKDLVIEALSLHLLRGAQGRARRGGLPARAGALAARRAAALAPLPRRPGRARPARAGHRRLQRHPARAQRGRVQRGGRRVVGRAAAGRAPLHAGRGRHRPRRVRRGRVRRHVGAELGGGARPGRGGVAARGQHALAPLVRGRGRAGRPAVRRGRLRRRRAPVPAVRGAVRPGDGHVGERGRHVRAALGRGRGRRGRRAVRRGRPRRAGRAPLGRALAARRRLAARAAHAARAPQRRRGRARQQAVRGRRGRRRRQPRQRRGVRPGHGVLVAAGGADVAGALVRRRVRGGADLTRAAPPAAARRGAPVRQRDGAGGRGRALLPAVRAAPAPRRGRAVRREHLRERELVGGGSGGGAALVAARADARVQPPRCARAAAARAAAPRARLPRGHDAPRGRQRGGRGPRAAGARAAGGRAVGVVRRAGRPAAAAAAAAAVRAAAARLASAAREPPPVARAGARRGGVLRRGVGRRRGRARGGGGGRGRGRAGGGGRGGGRGRGGRQRLRLRPGRLSAAITYTRYIPIAVRLPLVRDRLACCR